LANSSPQRALLRDNAHAAVTAMGLRADMSRVEK